MRRELWADVNSLERDETLVLQSQVAALHRPNRRTLDAFRHWFSKPFPVLGGVAKSLLDDENDLVALKTPPDLDYLSKFLRQHWPTKVSRESSPQTTDPKLIQKLLEQKEPARDGVLEIGRFNETSVSIAVNAISILIVAMLLIGSITTFTFISAPLTKLVLIAGWTAFFALSVAITTNARRAELFAATAAYVSRNDWFEQKTISNLACA